MSDMQSARPDLAQVVPQAPWIRRIPLRSPTLPPATHTNAYVIGESDLVIVDPGTPWPDAQAPLWDALRGLQSAGLVPRAIVLTHHHLDHASAAAELSREFSLPVWAHPQTTERLSGRIEVEIARSLHDGELLPFGPSGLRVLHTPGHAPGHVCLLDEAGGGLIAGDMVASQGTIIVSPRDDGDMALYLASLRRLLSLGPLRVWPAHGVAVEEGDKLLGRYLDHRLLREEKVVRALLSPAHTIDALLPLAYDDTPEALYPLARESLLAHLLALVSSGRVARRPQPSGEDHFVLLHP
ncbi:MAG: MBL fold metallo-hydrolase [Polyangia bacterium]